jgi:hypothetical protein
MGLVKDEDVEAIARMDEVDVQMALNTLGDRLKAR